MTNFENFLARIKAASTDEDIKDLIKEVTSYYKQINFEQITQITTALRNEADRDSVLMVWAASIDLEFDGNTLLSIASMFNDDSFNIRKKMYLENWYRRRLDKKQLDVSPDILSKIIFQLASLFTENDPKTTIKLYARWWLQEIAEPKGRADLFVNLAQLELFGEVSEESDALGIEAAVLLFEPEIAISISKTLLPDSDTDQIHFFRGFMSGRIASHPNEQIQQSLNEIWQLSNSFISDDSFFIALSLCDTQKIFTAIDIYGISELRFKTKFSELNIDIFLCRIAKIPVRKFRGYIAGEWLSSAHLNINDLVTLLESFSDEIEKFNLAKKWVETNASSLNENDVIIMIHQLTESRDRENLLNIVFECTPLYSRIESFTELLNQFDIIFPDTWSKMQISFADIHDIKNILNLLPYQRFRIKLVNTLISSTDHLNPPASILEILDFFDHDSKMEIISQWCRLERNEIFTHEIVQLYQELETNILRTIFMNGLRFKKARCTLEDLIDIINMDSNDQSNQVDRLIKQPWIYRWVDLNNGIELSTIFKIVCEVKAWSSHEDKILLMSQLIECSREYQNLSYETILPRSIIEIAIRDIDQFDLPDAILIGMKSYPHDIKIRSELIGAVIEIKYPHLYGDPKTTADPMIAGKLKDLFEKSISHIQDHGKFFEALSHILEYVPFNHKSSIRVIESRFEKYGIFKSLNVADFRRWILHLTHDDSRLQSIQLCLEMSPKISYNLELLDLLLTLSLENTGLIDLHRDARVQIYNQYLRYDREAFATKTKALKLYRLKIIELPSAINLMKVIKDKVLSLPAVSDGSNLPSSQIIMESLKSNDPFNVDNIDSLLFRFYIEKFYTPIKKSQKSSRNTSDINNDYFSNSEVLASFLSPNGMIRGLAEVCAINQMSTDAIVKSICSSDLYQDMNNYLESQNNFDKKSIQSEIAAYMIIQKVMPEFYEEYYSEIFSEKFPNISIRQMGMSKPRF